jgi:preprotein translocase subunit SecF
MWIIKHKKLFLIISATIVGLSLVFIGVFGLKRGIDFKGGSLMEVAFQSRPENTAVLSTLLPFNVTPTIQETGDAGILVKMRALTELERQEVTAAMTKTYPGSEIKNFTSIGPSVGKELTRKAIISIILVCLAIVFFIAYAFRRVSEPVSSWKYGLIAIVTLVHDIVIPSGLFAILGKTHGAEVDTLFVVALLTVLGLSVSDTIVVFDRIRENLRARKKDESFEHVVGHSIDQTFTRSINTSLTVILALLALFFFGPETTRYFALVLITGMFFGTYSSIFVASPLLTIVERSQERNRAK